LLTFINNQSKTKRKKVETHYGDCDEYDGYGHMDPTHLDIGNFFEDPNGKIDHLIGDGTVKK